jgi:hypothetical protein
LKNAELPKEIYAISGNHDYWNSKQFNEHQNMLKKLGVKLLENTSTNIYKDNEKITIHGIADPISFDNKEAEGITKTGLSKLKISDGYNILLFHRANMLDLFKNEKFDLIVSGHLHGGQVRIPFVGGLKSPHGDWFPKYSGGRYDVNNNTYIVSRGIGNPFIVPRVFNRPEIVVITLKKYK